MFFGQIDALASDVDALPFNSGDSIVNSGKGVYVDFDVQIGDRCKIQNNVNIYHGAELDAGVFIGPGAMVLNDKVPRAINPDGSLKDAEDWHVGKVRIGYGTALGGGAIVLPGVTIGAWASIFFV